ncbi:TPA: hypothetical protein HLT81_24165 [Escherichia coli]|nr:hypothetical protein [Escherichia coli]
MRIRKKWALIPALLSVLLAGSILSPGSMVSAEDLNYPHAVKPAAEVQFYGDFTPTPTARQEVHTAETMQWEYVTVTHDKKITNYGEVQSFNLKENTGENFQGLTGYSMVYLPEDQSQRITKIKSLAQRYNGASEWVADQVEALYAQAQSGTLPKEIYKTWNSSGKQYLWLSAGHLAYLSGGTDSLQKYGDQCISYIGKPCGTAQQIGAAGGEYPSSPNMGRAMLITTPFPRFVDVSLSQDKKKTTVIDKEKPFSLNVSFNNYAGWGTGAYVYMYLNGSPLAITKGTNPNQLTLTQSQRVGTDGAFGSKFNVSRDMSGYKSLLNEGPNTLTITVSDSYQRYNTFDLNFIVKAGPIDLQALNLKASKNPCDAGSTIRLSADVKNVAVTPTNNVQIVFYHDGQVIYNTRKNFTANQTQTVSFNWRVPNAPDANLSVIVDPNNETPDINRANNIQSLHLDINQLNSTPPTCGSQKRTAAWNASYNYISDHYTTADGDHVDIWDSKTVTYNEKLDMDVSVNTKQGIATDLKHPKSTDWESRGSWEIIPWASKNGLDPNKVTRAGYGIEVKVVTDYWTDWETKVPNGYHGTADPYGGKYYGPTNVKATFIDPQGKVIGIVNLEKTSGNKIKDTWELPEQSFTYYKVGGTVTHRKFMTPPTTKDGKLYVKIEATGAGRNGLNYCYTDTITIFGSMYDDTQNIRQRN